MTTMLLSPATPPLPEQPPTPTTPPPTPPLFDRRRGRNAARCPPVTAGADETITNQPQRNRNTMSKETSNWLNNNVLVGMTDKRGNAWHYKASE